METKSFIQRSRPNDVFMDGSDLGDSHPGNSYFTDLLLLHLQDFGDCRTARDEREDATSIWSKVFHGRNGNFLVYSPNGPQKYEVLDQATVVRKICKVMRKLLPALTRKKPRLAMEQLRLLQREVKTMRGANQTLRQDLSNLAKDCGTYQCEIVALKISCANWNNDVEQIEKVQIALGKRLTYDDCLSPSPIFLSSRRRRSRSSSFDAEREGKRLRLDVSVLKRQEGRNPRRLANAVLDHEDSLASRQHDERLRRYNVIELRRDGSYPPPFMQGSDDSPRRLKREIIDL